MSELRHKPYGNTKFETVEQYHACFSEPVKRQLNEMFQLIQHVVPGAEVCIRYNIPTFRLDGNLVHHAAFKTHIGFYPTPEAIEFFRKELQPYKTSKGAIQFPLDQKLPEQLIQRIVKHRVQIMHPKME